MYIITTNVGGAIEDVNYQDDKGTVYVLCIVTAPEAERKPVLDPSNPFEEYSRLLAFSWRPVHKYRPGGPGPHHYATGDTAEVIGKLQQRIAVLAKMTNGPDKYMAHGISLSNILYALEQGISEQYLDHTTTDTSFADLKLHLTPPYDLAMKISREHIDQDKDFLVGIAFNSHGNLSRLNFRDKKGASKKLAALNNKGYHGMMTTGIDLKGDLRVVGSCPDYKTLEFIHPIINGTLQEKSFEDSCTIIPDLLDEPEVVPSSKNMN